MIVINITMKVKKMLCPIPWVGIKITPMIFVNYIVYKFLSVDWFFGVAIKDNCLHITGWAWNETFVGVTTTHEACKVTGVNVKVFPLLH